MPVTVNVPEGVAEVLLLRQSVGVPLVVKEPVTEEVAHWVALPVLVALAQ